MRACGWTTWAASYRALRCIRSTSPASGAAEACGRAESLRPPTERSHRRLPVALMQYAGLGRVVHTDAALATVQLNPALALLDPVVVDARVPPPHQAVLVELPVLVPVASPPLPVCVARLVLEAHRD